MPDDPRPLRDPERDVPLGGGGNGGKPPASASSALRKKPSRPVYSWTRSRSGDQSGLKKAPSYARRRSIRPLVRVDEVGLRGQPSGPHHISQRPADASRSRSPSKATKLPVAISNARTVPAPSSIADPNARVALRGLVQRRADSPAGAAADKQSSQSAQSCVSTEASISASIDGGGSETEATIENLGSGTRYRTVEEACTGPGRLSSRSR